MGVAKSINQTKLISRDVAEPRLGPCSPVGPVGATVGASTLPPCHPRHRTNGRTTSSGIKGRSISWPEPVPSHGTAKSRTSQTRSWGSGRSRGLGSDHPATSRRPPVCFVLGCSRGDTSSPITPTPQARSNDGCTLPDAPVHSILCDAYRVDVADGTTSTPRKAAEAARGAVNTNRPSSRAARFHFRPSDPRLMPRIVSSTGGWAKRRTYSLAS